MNGCSTNMDFVNYMHIHDFLMHSAAKEIVIKLPNMSMDNFWTPLSVSTKAERLVIIGPCEGLAGSKTKLFCQNLQEIFLKPLSHNCIKSSSDESSDHINGICVLDVETVLNSKTTVQFYNNIFVGDLMYMQRCSANNVLTERFFEDYKISGGRKDKTTWLEKWTQKGQNF